MRIETYLRSSPFFSLLVAQSEILTDIQRRLESEGVHFLQALILTGLFFEDSAVRPSRLAKSLRADKSTLSHALRDLERKGLVERHTSPDDARAYLFALTRDGKKRVPRLIKFFDKLQAEIEAAPRGRRLNSQLLLFIETYKRSARNKA